GSSIRCAIETRSRTSLLILGESRSECSTQRRSPRPVSDYYTDRKAERKTPMVQQAVLNGVRILSLEQVHVLPWGTAFLADFGAEVIRVESADHMNDRRSGPFPDSAPGDEWWNEGGTFAYWARNKQSLCLDVTHPLGKEVFLKLVAHSDI